MHIVKVMYIIQPKCCSCIVTSYVKCTLQKFYIQSEQLLHISV